MKLISKIAILSLLFVFIITSCSKETSLETGALTGNANASLLDVAGSCQDIAVKGNYAVDSILNDSNFINVKINFLTPGKYLVATDTVNGMWFRDSGFSTVTGTQTIKIKGFGKPLLPGDHAFIAQLNTSACLFNVNVTGSVGIGAIYSLVSTGSTCSATTSSGTYTAGTPLAAANTLTVKVNVTSIGSYAIGTNTVNGIRFVATGSFTATGAQDVILIGTGTPSSAGTYTFNVASTAGTCQCSLLVNPSAAASDYFPTTLNSNWTYSYLPGAAEDTIRVMSFNKTATINAKTYRYFVNDYGDSSLHVRSGNDYYEAGYFDFYPLIDPIIDSIGPVEFIFLKDNVPVANSWETAEGVAKENGNLGVAKARFTIMQKDISYTAQGNLFTNVIAVKREVMFKKNGDPSFTTLAEATSYYAKGVGLIDIAFVNPGAFSVSILKYNVF